MAKVAKIERTFYFESWHSMQFGDDYDAGIWGDGLFHNYKFPYPPTKIYSEEYHIDAKSGYCHGKMVADYRFGMDLARHIQKGDFIWQSIKIDRYTIQHLWGVATIDLNENEDKAIIYFKNFRYLMDNNYIMKSVTWTGSNDGLWKMFAYNGFRDTKRYSRGIIPGALYSGESQASAPKEKWNAFKGQTLGDLYKTQSESYPFLYWKEDRYSNASGQSNRGYIYVDMVGENYLSSIDKKYADIILNSIKTTRVTTESGAGSALVTITGLENTEHTGLYFCQNTDRYFFGKTVQFNLNLQPKDVPNASTFSNYMGGMVTRGLGATQGGSVSEFEITLDCFKDMDFYTFAYAFFYKRLWIDYKNRVGFVFSKIDLELKNGDMKCTVGDGKSIKLVSYRR